MIPEAVAEIEELSERILRVATPEGFTGALGIALHEGEATEWLENKRGFFAKGPFLWADLRVNRLTGMMFLVLHVREELGIEVAQLDLKRHGEEPIAVNVEPDVPPEGTSSFVYDARGVLLTYTFTTFSRLLRLVTFKWPPR